MYQRSVFKPLCKGVLGNGDAAPREDAHVGGITEDEGAEGKREASFQRQLLWQRHRRGRRREQGATVAEEKGDILSGLGNVRRD